MPKRSQRQKKKEDTTPSLSAVRRFPVLDEYVVMQQVDGEEEATVFQKGDWCADVFFFFNALLICSSVSLFRMLGSRLPIVTMGMTTSRCVLNPSTRAQTVQFG